MDPDGRNDRITVQLSVTMADITAFSRYVETSPPVEPFRRNRRLYMALCFLGGASFAFTDLYWMLLAIVAPISVVSVLLRRSSAKARFELIQSSFEGELTADATGFTVRRAGSASQINWSALQELVVTDTHLFACWSPLVGYVIPRRCLRDPEDTDRMIRWRLAAKAEAIRRPPPPPPYRPFTDAPGLS